MAAGNSNLSIDSEIEEEDELPCNTGGPLLNSPGVNEKHQHELKSLTLTTKPCTTMKFFVFAMYDYVKQSVAYLLAKGGWLLVFSSLVMSCGVLLATMEGSHGKHAEEVLRYIQFVLWWTALGVASSIGLGSGLHTFVLYLGPHIALFTIKAMQCGRVDLKNAPYDTIQLKRGPSWLDKDCADFGPPLFESVHGSRVPLMSILPQVQLEAVLWGVGTALGELPPYFISRAAFVCDLIFRTSPLDLQTAFVRVLIFRTLPPDLHVSQIKTYPKVDAASLSGSNPVEKLDASSPEDNGIVGRHLKHVKHWLLSHSQYMNGWTILLLASVPNPLFDLAGIMCGQFGVPFWQFFLATLVGKAVIKTHIQTFFIISVCNNQLLNWVENELIWVLSHIPGVASVLPTLIAKLHAAKDKYLVTAPPVAANIQAKKWGLSFASIWNTVVWLVLLNFFFKIVNATAQNFLKKEQEKELKKES